VEYGRPKTLYNRWIRWSRKGIFARILMELAREGDNTDTLMIDATHLKAYRTASSLGRKNSKRPHDWPDKGWAELKTACCHGCFGSPIRMFLSAGNLSDYKGALALLSSLPKAKWLLADRGCDADWFRNALKEREIDPCIPSRRNRKVAIPHDAERYR